MCDPSAKRSHILPQNEGCRQNSLAEAPNSYRESYTWLLNAAAVWLQPADMNFDVLPKAALCREGHIFCFIKKGYKLKMCICSLCVDWWWWGHIIVM